MSEQNDMQLPELRIELTGLVTASNLDVFKTRALSVIDGITTDLQTDEDFAGAEKTVKWCKAVEDRLDDAKQQALSQTSSIGALFKALDEIREMTRTKRLELDKAVKSQKDAIRMRMVLETKTELLQHLNALNARLGGTYMPLMRVEFGDVIKGLKSVASMQQSLKTVLDREKIQANEMADRIDGNLKASAEHRHLCPDLTQTAVMDAESFQIMLEQRIAAHEKRMEAERERMRADEERKAEMKAQAAAKEEANRRMAEIRQADAQKPIEEQKTSAQVSSRTPNPVQVMANFNTEPVQPEETNGTGIRDDIADFMRARDFGDDTMLVRYVLTEFRKFVAARDDSLMGLVRDRQAEIKG